MLYKVLSYKGRVYSGDGRDIGIVFTTFFRFYLGSNDILLYDGSKGLYWLCLFIPPNKF